MSNLVSVLFSPGATFQKMREKGGVVLPLIVLSLISLLIIWINMPLVEKGILTKIKGQSQPISTDTILLIGKITAYAGSFFSIAVAVFIIGLLLMVVNMFISGEAKYMQLVKVALYSSIPGLISGFIMAIVLRATNAESMNAINISLASLLSEKKGFLFALLNLFNPFSIWGVVLMIIGTAVMAGKPVAKVAPIILIVWVALNLGLGLIGQ